MDADDVLALRLATQRLVGPPMASPDAAVSRLLAVQAQDAPLSLASVALRTGGTADDARGALDAGEILRTHVLRPTWHLVAASDLRWLLELTSPRVLRGLAGRQRQLGLDEATIAAALDVILSTLDAAPRPRSALKQALVRGGVLDDSALLGQQAAHLVMIAELRCLIASGPVGTGLDSHTYALAERRLPPTAPRNEAESLAELVGRFVASHGPVTLADLQRWTKLTLAEARAARAALGDALATASVDGLELWYDVAAADAAAPHLAAAREATMLLPVFDEAFLSYHGVEFPRTPGHPMGDAPHRFAETGGGVVISRLRYVGTWVRTHTARGFALSLRMSAGATRGEREASVTAAERFAAVAAPDAVATLTLA